MINHIDIEEVRKSIKKFEQSLNDLESSSVNREKAEQVLFHTASELEAISVLLWPVMPSTSDKLRAQLGLDPINPEAGRDYLQELKTPRESYTLKPGDPLFMKIKKNEVKL